MGRHEDLSEFDQRAKLWRFDDLTLKHFFKSKMWFEEHNNENEVLIGLQIP